VTLRPAVFLDRDGTVVDDPGYLSDPDRAALLPGAGEALARLAGAGYALVVVTNQSGIGRGFFTEHDFHRVMERVNRLLADAGAVLDATNCTARPSAIWRSTWPEAGGSATA